MAGFQDIIGQEQICEHLQTALKLQKVSHAYIINGERNSGKNLSRGFSPWRCSVPERGKSPVRFAVRADRRFRKTIRILSGLRMKTEQHRCRGYPHAGQ